MKVEDRLDALEARTQALETIVRQLPRQTVTTAPSPPRPIITPPATPTGILAGPPAPRDLCSRGSAVSPSRSA